MNTRSHPTRDRLLDLFDINVETGVITWKRSRGRAAAGSIAGRKDFHGYRRMFIDGGEYMAHAVIYFIAHDEWPSLIDHINGVRDDNRVANLRSADRAANARNRTKFKESKLPGVHRYGDSTFMSRITYAGKQFNLGVFQTEEAAHQAYITARKRVSVAETLAAVQVLEELQATREAA